jgi:hypothetical protein
VRRALAQARVQDDGRLGTHSLRKTWARRVYRASGNDIITVKAALGHADVSSTQRYLDPDEGKVWAAMRRVDFTRRPRRQSWPEPRLEVAAQSASGAPPKDLLTFPAADPLLSGENRVMTAGA